MEELQGQIISGVIALVGTVLSWVLVSARDYIRRKIENDYVESLLLRVADAVEVGVRDAAGTVVPKLKEAAADRKILPAEAANLRSRVRNAAMDQLTMFDRNKLEELFDRPTLERKLNQLIEAALQRIKEGK